MASLSTVFNIICVVISLGLTAYVTPSSIWNLSPFLAWSLIALVFCAFVLFLKTIIRMTLPTK